MGERVEEMVRGGRECGRGGGERGRVWESVRDGER